MPISVLDIKAEESSRPPSCNNLSGLSQTRPVHGFACFTAKGEANFS